MHAKLLNRKMASGSSHSNGKQKRVKSPSPVRAVKKKKKEKRNRLIDDEAEECDDEDDEDGLYQTQADKDFIEDDVGGDEQEEEEGDEDDESDEDEEAGAEQQSEAEEMPAGHVDYASDPDDPPEMAEVKLKLKLKALIATRELTKTRKEAEARVAARKAAEKNALSSPPPAKTLKQTTLPGSSAPRKPLTTKGGTSSKGFGPDKIGDWRAGSKFVKVHKTKPSDIYRYLLTGRGKDCVWSAKWGVRWSEYRHDHMCTARAFKKMNKKTGQIVDVPVGDPYAYFTFMVHKDMPEEYDMPNIDPVVKSFYSNNKLCPHAVRTRLREKARDYKNQDPDREGHCVLPISIKTKQIANLNNTVRNKQPVKKTNLMKTVTTSEDTSGGEEAGDDEEDAGRKLEQQMGDDDDTDSSDNDNDGEPPLHRIKPSKPPADSDAESIASVPAKYKTSNGIRREPSRAPPGHPNHYPLPEQVVSYYNSNSAQVEAARVAWKETVYTFEKARAGQVPASEKTTELIAILVDRAPRFKELIDVERAKKKAKPAKANENAKEPVVPEEMPPPPAYSAYVPVDEEYEEEEEKKADESEAVRKPIDVTE